MKDRTFALVILDSAGESIKRFTLKRIYLQIGIGLLAGSIIASIFFLAMLVRLNATAKESRTYEHVNALMFQKIVDAENKLIEVKRQHDLVELAYLQLCKKSQIAIQLPTEIPTATLDADHVLQKSAFVLYELYDLLNYFDDAKHLLTMTPSIRPTTRGSMTSHFGKRLDPFNSAWVLHKGIDFSGVIGMPIFAPADGVVIFTGERGSYGRTIVIDHGFGLQSHFAHLSSFVVTPGERIKRGETIGRMGSTGRSTGPHLHYEVRRDGRPLNPLNFILD
jgi:murein DD-endopeptidase MepM/ murein hydrolase activator NlpD